MKRVLALVITIAGCGALAVFGTGAADDAGKSPTFWVEFDDAFGLIKGGDLKIAGVRAGTIGELKVQPKTHRALVEIQINKTGFGSIRTDVTCQARPQSLIGEYFVDCQPGTARTALEPGSTIPVSRTSSVVAPDLVNNVLRRPYRERFSIIVNELGAAVAGNAQNLNDAVKRASPGLRETDKVLKVLADQNKILANLIRDADTVIGDLADNKQDVARWVEMADRTSSASAERSADIARGFNRLPGFLEELGPTMKQLGNVADEQTPALRTLSDAAPDLKTLFDRLGPFAEASRPAFKALGQASKTGSQAVKAAGPTVAELEKFAKGAPELANNLDIVLDHLNDRGNAAEEDANSPTGKGYTGLEALLQYVFDQGNSINIYDSSVHILKVAPFVGPCEHYSDVERAMSVEDGVDITKTCSATLGPNSAGLNFPDTTRPDGMPLFGPIPAGMENPFSARRVSAAKSIGDSVRRGSSATPERTTTPATPPAAAGRQPEPHVPTLSDVIPGAPDLVLPTPPKAIQDLTKGQQAEKTQSKLLDYLLGA